jgi:hypothetical protein
MIPLPQSSIASLSMTAKWLHMYACGAQKGRPLWPLRDPENPFLNGPGSQLWLIGYSHSRARVELG